MKTLRTLAGLLRKDYAQSRCFTSSASPLVPRRCQIVQEIVQSPHKLHWGACGRTQVFSLSHFGMFAPKTLFSSVASPELSRKESSPDSTVEVSEASKGEEKAELLNQKQSDAAEKKEAAKGRHAETKKTAKKMDSDSESELYSGEEDELSTEDLIKLVQEKEELLKEKQKEIEKMQEKVLRSYAEVENVMDRARREAENSKKFAIQNFAKSLLDVADNLGRASSVVKESFSKIDPSKDSTGAAQLLKTLLEGVEMTEKQLSEVFKKFGVEKFDPINEQFDPHRHLAVFQVPDASKPSGTVAMVLKSGYTLHERVIRPAEVGVVEAVNNEAAENSEPST